ncbi:diaminopimelate epimerase [Niabella ginsenosidivorans]|uniref:Diaminopimelate epimerase n=1 Tax=Niabella ginsenosidivorans TaxID=1176587 RepID=A0A1A9I416_9BACT|nr:diaminopimelate epimerase [Niabella ginsenosidivorans]ANH81450.1 diaminopimelate epimerase [Niabella ginsenosidivorans]
MEITFYKYQGTGNDFVLADNRRNHCSRLTEEQIKHICDRRFGIGADGFMLLNEKEGYDFEMVYYNADGWEGSMCGNGGRCIVKFANDLGIKKNRYVFLATDGPHEATLEGDAVSLKMKDVEGIRKYKTDSVLNTGSPHYVQLEPDVMSLDVVKEGQRIRYSKEYTDEGINVNFVQVKEDGSLIVRTYERGVENETYSCGTGVTAAALVFHHNDNGFNSIDIETIGGKLNVRYHRELDGSFNNIWLKGPALQVFKGTINITGHD